MLNYTRIPAPRVTLVDLQTGIVANEWFRFFNNLYSIAYAATGSVTAGTYGSATAVPQITVDDFGGIIAVTNVPIAIDASQIVSGTIASARISGSYTGITGVGTLTVGTWNASAITTPYGGTGLSSYTAGDTLYYASGSGLSKLAIGVSTYINTSSGTAPQWTDPATITIGKATNIVGGAVNRIAYQTAADTTGFIVAPTVSNTYLEWSGTAFQWTANPLGTVTSVAASVPSFLSISGSPITTSGTLAISYSGTALPVANGGTNATSASITAFNNITGYTASGATGTTSTNLVFSTSPTLVTPTLGVATATSINKMTITAPATSSTLVIADGKTLTASNTLTLSGTDSTTMTFPTTTATIARTDAAQTFTGAQTFSSTIGGATTIGVGAATPSASGAGITFPATQSASTDANTLDDYEEGTWSPLVQGSTTAGVGTYAASKGIYTKIGNIVTVQAYINITAHTGTGNIQLSALPFTSFATADYYGTANIGYIQNCALTAGNFPLGFISPNTTYVGLYQNPTGGGAMAAVPMDTAFSIMYTATYRTV